jgi:FkbH-like protein
LLRAAAAVGGIDVSVHLGDFGAHAQEILDNGSGLYRFAPDVVVLAVQTRDVAPDLWNGFADLSPEAVTAAIGRVVADFRTWIAAFRARSRAHLIVHNLESPAFPRAGVLDAQAETGQSEAIRAINGELGRLARTQPGVYVLDYDALVARHGRLAWRDERKWLTMRMPIAAPCMIRLVEEWLRFVHPLTGRVCKALVTDLDNTVWGGVVGEDGLAGIALGPEYPGAAYQALQRAILDLYQRGIILAICSKNNAADAMEALEGHPGMLLRPRHFAAMRINWSDKVQNLREIAAELNIGVDALAFLDDNPAERERVRSGLPEVAVIDLPDDPMAYAHALQQSPLFQRLNLSEEDRERGRYYAEERLRAELQRGAASLEDFYRSLLMEAEISTLTPATLARVAQLTQKTNQFNLTTRRYTEQQIAALAADPAWRVYSVRLVDRFGDHGLVGVLIIRCQPAAWEIDTFLLSCRVIGRTLETAVLATLAEQARFEGAARLVGWYVPTRKNAQVKDLYRAHGFACALEQDGSARWELDLGRAEIAPPPWIKRTLLAKGTPPCSR